MYDFPSMWYIYSCHFLHDLLHLWTLLGVSGVEDWLHQIDGMGAGWAIVGDNLLLL
jgi:hypothetical protein